MDINNETQFNDVHRVLLQHFIAKRCIFQEQALDSLLIAISIYENIPIDSVVIDISTLELYIFGINNVITCLDLEIRKTIDQSTGIVIWILVYFF